MASPYTEVMFTYQIMPNCIMTSLMLITRPQQLAILGNGRLSNSCPGTIGGLVLPTMWQSSQLHVTLATMQKTSLLSGMGPVPVRPGLVSTGIDPMCRGLASLKGPPSLLSQQPKWSLQGLYRD